ncbi:transmembrane protein, putative [Bodo saltans]|uniref:Transmembrane protein, putative n=1 Tax=Bodo saltans TaxID=75058 RepID=A0A0S4IQ04_BODSA|nr:transmembrane protein, putative [Bodo saltans]|eukprot:CUE72167.1 transmembrane protein, putative [Bodo saltans]
MTGATLDLDDVREKVGGFCSKFFSIIIAVLLDIITLIYTIGAGHLVRVTDSFTSIGFAHFLGIVSAIASAALYTLLHFVPKRAYRLLYLITFVNVLSLFLVSHSMGLTAPTVDDCDDLGAFSNATAILANQTSSIGDITWVILHGGNATAAVGRLGQSLGDCTTFALTFATALLIIILQLVALFDTQRMLLTRVRSKTYGERFVEMGIK